MAKLKGTTNNIAYAVAYKAAVDLITAGTVELETEDIGAEVADLGDILFEHYSERMQEEPARGKGGGGQTRSSGRSGSSNRRGSSRSGSSRGGGGNSGGKPSGKQLAYLSDLIRDRDHGLDFEEDGDDVVSIDGKDLADLTRGEVSSLIEKIREEPEL